MEMEELDDDSRPKRSGTVLSATAHVTTAVVGSGVLSLAWSIAQLGWIAGPVLLLLFAYVTYYTSNMLADCYRYPDPVTGKRCYRYMDAVKAYLDSKQVWWCAFSQYSNLAATAIGYTVTAGSSMVAVKRSVCFHGKGKSARCYISNNPYMIIFGVVQIVFSQIPDFDRLSWLSTVAAIMSFCYSTVGLVLGMVKVIDGGEVHGTIDGVVATTAQKTWLTFQALGNIAFAYSFSMILIEIQDTLKPKPPENKTMKQATLIGLVVITAFYMAIGCVNYAAFGNNSPGNLLTGFGFYDPYWLISFANVCIAIHLVGAYQVFSQPLFEFVEHYAAKKWPKDALHKIRVIKLPFVNSFMSITIFRLIWRTSFVIFSTVVAMLLPFFNDVVGFIGAIGFWPLTVYFPIEMHLKQRQIQRWSTKWIMLQLLSIICLIISIASGVGSIEGIYQDLHKYKPFKTQY